MYHRISTSALCPVGLAALLLLGPAPAPAQTLPAARRTDHVDVHFGHPVPDPYRWMEQPSVELTEWLHRQDRFTREYAAAFQGRKRIRETIARASRVDRFSPVAAIAGRFYFIKADGSFSQRSLLVIDPDGRETVVIDGASLPAETRLSAAAVSPDGRLLAYGVVPTGTSRGGGAWSEIRFRDLRTGRELPDRLTGLYGAGSRSSMAWQADGSGLYYERYQVPANLTAKLGAERLYFHRLGTEQAGDALIHDPMDADQVMTTRVSADGRYLVVGVGRGGAVENRVLIADARSPGSPLRPLVDSADAAYFFLGSRDQTLWFQTTSGAPNWRIIAIDAQHPQPDRRKVVVPESEDAMEPTIGAAMVGNRFIVAYRHDAWLGVRVFDSDGSQAYDLQLPKIASIWTGFVGQQSSTDALYTVTDFADPGTLYRLDVASGRSEVVRRPAMAYNPDDFVTRQVFYRSKDGTRIPMFISYKRSNQPDTAGRRPPPRPTIIYGYGAFSWAASPWFRPDLVGWMDAGGVFALPNIRGGGEYGEAWHRAAVTTRKQVAIDDYIAAAEWLVSEGFTTVEQLVGNGGSASGAMVGAALVQRPDLFAAITLDYPALDMIRLDQFTGGRQWRSEFGSTENEAEFKALLAYSPYHNIKPGACYPATLVLPGELDQTTVPMHAYKFVAALQHAQSCRNPIFLRVSWGAGHTAGADLEDSIDNWADQLAILMRLQSTQQPRSDDSHH